MKGAGYLRMAARVLILGCLLIGFAAICARGQTDKGQEASVHFLIAQRAMPDPIFQRSVILMLPSEGLPLVVGIIVNKPTHIPLGKLFPKSPALKNRVEAAYFGGPVDIESPSLIFRSAKAAKHAIRLAGDVYVTFDPGLIEARFRDPKGAKDLRLFLGRAQWAPGQLQNEMLRGGWYSLRAEGSLIFSAHPEGVWRTLLERAQPGTVVEYRNGRKRSLTSILSAL